MKSPFPPGDPRYADTFDWGGYVVQEAAHRDFPDKDTEILDVGPGFGKYHFLLPEYPMDACEIWEMTVVKEKLEDLYRTVYTQDICDLVESPDWTGYPLVIMGDVFEHIARDRAKKCIDQILDTCENIYIITPFMHPQGPELGNPYQVHIQDDLTPQLMFEEFPRLRLSEIETRDGREYKGFYRRR